MFFVLFYVSRSVTTEEFSISAPFSVSNPYEEKLWSLIDDTFKMKHFIRMTEDLPNRKGKMCLRVPISGNEWSATFETNAFTGSNGTWVIIYSEELCPDINSNINGFGIIMNTTKGDIDKEPSVYIGEAKHSKLMFQKKHGYCGLPARSDVGTTAVIKISRTDNEVSGTTGRKEDEYYNPCNTHTINITDIKTGYLTAIAINTNNSYTNNDLFSIDVNINDDSLPNQSINYDSINRKILHDFFTERSSMKQQRRSLMTYMLKYLSDADNRKGQLTEGAKQELIDAMNLVNETIWRLNQSITSEFLNKYLNETIATNINTARKKLEFANSRFSELKDQFNKLWTYMESELGSIRKESAEQMEIITKETQTYMKILASNGKDSPLYKHADVNYKEELEKGESSLILLVVCVFEAFLYILFFLYRRHKTLGFKKAD